ncbi:MAG: nickel pincer cofactor biosynthesis protein LarB [Oscillatoriales cyanobacterium SM2_2_1]|nr:nickel pincer cofactor biosynthesis protein LarB [Oscillatoriales cyanobacterium SM2_2_1]
MERLRELLHQVAVGTLSPDQALADLRYFDIEPVADFAQLDHHRQLRTGFPEVIFGLGKTPDQIAQLMQRLSDGAVPAIATKVTAPTYTRIQPHLRGVQYFPLAQIAYLGPPPPPQPGTITMVTAGTADIPIAMEAAVTAELCGYGVTKLWDVGVAGIHRLLQHRRLLDEAKVIVAIAGMEGAMVSVIAGLVRCPIIAVPTSVGYGASFEGLAALLGMLNSCATGIGVVNIDNGFGAAMLAAKILQQVYGTRTSAP